MSLKLVTGGVFGGPPKCGHWSVPSVGPTSPGFFPDRALTIDLSRLPISNKRDCSCCATNQPWVSPTYPRRPPQVDPLPAVLFFLRRASPLPPVDGPPSLGFPGPFPPFFPRVCADTHELNRRLCSSLGRYPPSFSFPLGFQPPQAPSVG